MSLLIPYQPLKAVLWDIDGTVSDSFRLGFESTRTVLTNNGQREITEDDYHQGTKFTTPRRFAWHVTGNPDDPIGERLGEEFDLLYVKLVSSTTAPLFSGILDLFTNLKTKNLKLGALSNACGAYVRAVLLENNIDDIFDAGFGADEVPKSKPHADGLLKLCRTIGVEPASSIYIGDSPSDGLAATAAGMNSIGVSWGSHPKHSLLPVFTYTVDTVEELDQKIQSMIAGQK